jgi:acetoin utilization deacetylase AcuC-like enzyme
VTHSRRHAPFKRPRSTAFPPGPFSAQPAGGPPDGGLLGRLWQGLTRRLFPPPELEVVYHPGYELPISGVSHDAERAKHILTYLLAEGWIAESHVHSPRPVSYRLLRRVHRDDYLERLRDPAALIPVIGVPVSVRELDAVIQLQRLATGGTLLACELALAHNSVAVNLSGGYHHARPDGGGGFCVFNDVAVAIAELRARGFGGRVLVVDLDLHDGDGTRLAFAKNQTVYTFSIHNRDWAGHEAVAATTLALGAGVDDATYLAAVREHLPPVMHAFEPELVIYLAGVDPAADDTLGNWKISGAGLLARDRCVLELARRRPHPLPVAIVLAGGYGPNAWRHSARTLAWLSSGRVVEPPSSEELTLQRYRNAARQLSRTALSGEPEPEADDWGLSETDLLGGVGMPADSRMLGFYTPQGVEFALERTGFLDKLRLLGFPDPFVEVDLDNRSGQTLRVYADPSREELLVELRARRDRQAIPGMEVLFLEWLLLQNPRGRFTRERPALPGQKHPGLGVLTDAIALMVLVCDRLGLDGIAFVPSHFHLATQGRKFLRFLDPRHEAEVRALDAALRGIPLTRATQLVATGRLRDTGTGQAYTWHPMLMVLPVSDRLRHRLDDKPYWQAVQAAEGSVHFFLEEPEPAKR